MKETKGTSSSKKHIFLFGRRKKLLSLEEGKIETQAKTILKRYCSRKLNIFAVAIFVLMLLCVLIGPIIYPLDVNYQELTQQNVSPGLTMLSIPKELENNASVISAGSTFGVGASKEGKLYIWGKTKVSKKIDLKKLIPDDMGEVVQVSAGFDHILALNKEGELFAWGNERFQQCEIPSKVSRLKNIKQIYAGYQCSFAVTETGQVYCWGNDSTLNFIVGEYQGKVDKIAVASSGVLALTKEGEVVVLGKESASLTKIPENLGKVVDLATTAQSACAISEDGTVTVWGNTERNLGKVPDIEGTPIAVQAGRYHYSLLTKEGKVYSWGFNNFKQATVPKKVANSSEIKQISTGYFQNYAIDDSGKVYTWGLKGYLFGTDGYGREVLARLLEGGRMTMTIGCVSVIISTILGVIIGGCAGYFGGKVDILLMRFEEIVASLPFLPFAMILSAIIGNSISETGRILLIMVILGLLSWTSLSRLVRAQVLAEREKEYILAGKAMGVKEWSLIFKHILPNVISVVIVNATLGFATCMLIESSLSYLGFGVMEPNPTWGNMLNGCNDSVVIQSYWWRWVVPVIALGICTISINIIGDGLRDAVDPKAEER